METGERLKAENEKLHSENERQMAEIASMKKKIKLAMKKQRADLLAKIQAAEERAVVAEAAVAAVADAGNSSTVYESTPQIGTLQGPGQMISACGTASASSSSSLSLASSDGEILHRSLSQYSNGNSLNCQTSVDSLVAELAVERQRSLQRKDEAAKERQRLENEVCELRKTNDTSFRQRDEARAHFDEETKPVKGDAEQRVQQMTKANEMLEAQLLGAAVQVAEAFPQMPATREDMERISKEGFEAKSADSYLIVEHQSVCHQLERCRAALAEAQRKLLDKAKDMEEMAAAGKSAQEGQEAAMSQLMYRLAEMEAAVTGQQAQHLRELQQDEGQSLLQEEDDFLKELEKCREAIPVLRDDHTEKKDHLLSAETGPENMDSIRRDHSDKRIPDMKAEYEHLLDELRSQTNSLKKEVEELRMPSQQADLSTHKEFSFLREQLEESSARQEAAENQIKRLSAACNKAENQVTTIKMEAADAHRNLDDEIKLRDDKYGELDAKFGRLQKRAKQRIQEVQKEKEELETQLAATRERAAEALSRQAAIQDDVERVQYQASDALRALDAERQQLRATSTKLTEEIEDLRRTLDRKEHNLAESHRLASGKDQIALELTATLKETEANHESLLVDCKEKHRTVEENMSAQLADATLENVKMAETISALQTQLGVKESKLAELDAATSGEMVRLGASFEAVKGEVSRQELEHKREQEQWQASLEKFRRKLDEAEKVTHAQTVLATELKSQLESELERQRQVLNITLADLSAAIQENNRVARDFAAYKVRANAVLQKKEVELLAAKNFDLSAAQETALKEAKQEAIVAAMERDGALNGLQDSVLDYENKLAARDISVLDAEQRIRDLATKLEISKGQLLAKQEEWQIHMDRSESTWRLKYDTLEAKVRGSVEADLNYEYTALMTAHKILKIESETVRALLDTTIEEKDKEIASLLEDNTAFRRPSASQTQARNDVQSIQDLERGVSQVAEQQILLVARQQAQRENEVIQCRRHIQALQEEITDLEHENRLHSRQGALLKEELRSLERSHKRDDVDMTYLKNVILKLLETGEVEALLPVVGMLLQFSPDELKRCHDSYNNITASSVGVVIDTSAWRWVLIWLKWKSILRMFGLFM